MSNILLIHGAWGGAWVYNDLIRELESRGHSATAIDLPGHGADTTEIAEVTMDAYVERVVREISAHHESGVVLAGHSLAGSVISAVAERNSDSIESLVYLCALLPKHGQTPIELMKSDAGGWLLPRIEFSDDQSYATVSETTVREVFLHDVIGHQRVADLVSRFAIKQATQPFMVEAELSGERFDSVPKAYVRCERDRVMSTELQDLMISSWDVDRVVNLDSGHFPLLSMADRLADAIDQAVGTPVSR